jgi:RimJ/RimL family protein N-acetyltransferase
MFDRTSLSPGWQTHLMFAEFDGEVTAHADHLVVRSPRSPGYYWGNFLLYDRLPADTDFGPWMQRFEQAIVQREPSTGHVAFGMQSKAAAFEAPPAFAAAGFEAFGVATLTLQPTGLQPLAQVPDAAYELRPLVLPREIHGVVDLSAACNDEGYEPEGYRHFRTAQMQRYADMAAAGMGHWWGALHQGQVVAALGLFGQRHVGRFQHVETHPAHRRRGLCRALVHAACSHGFAHMGWHTLVMGADPHDVAIGIYRQVGFNPQDTLWMLERRAPEDRAGP